MNLDARWAAFDPSLRVTERHWISPNGVDHLVVNDRCITCGMGPHRDRRK